MFTGLMPRTVKMSDLMVHQNLNVKHRATSELQSVEFFVL